MNTKYLIETLTEIPDKELLAELSGIITKSNKLMIPDLQKFFIMLSCLFSGSNKEVKSHAIILYRNIFDKILVTEIEQSWNIVAKSVISMLGEPDEMIRKSARSLLTELIDKTNNANMIMEKLYYIGFESQFILITLNSISQCLAILSSYKSILHNKTSINITRLIVEKAILFSSASHSMEIKKKSREFLNQLFYLHIQKFDEVLELLNEELLKILERIWSENKEKMLMADKEEGSGDLKKIMQISYEHLPLINGLFFGVYEKYVFKNIFNPQVKAAKLNAIKIFKQTYEKEEIKLQKYMNVIFKIIIKFLPEKNYDLILLLKKIVSTPGKNNVINLSILPEALVPQLSHPQVPYRKQVRDILKLVNLDIPMKVVKKYEEELNENPTMNWMQKFQIFLLLEHWIDHNMEQSYPPTLNLFLPHLCHSSENSQIKVKQKGLQVLVTILDRYPGYRENLEEILNEERIGEIEDMMEEKRKRNKHQAGKILESEQIFKQQYIEERERFMRFKQNQK